MAKIKPGTMTALVFAILIGLAGAYVVREHLNQEAPIVVEEKAPPTSVLIPVAAYDLKPGWTIGINDVIPIKMKPDAFKHSQFAQKSFMNNTQQIAGRTLRRALKKGEAFSTDMLYPDGMGPGIADMLKPGQVAVSIPVQNISSVAGFARPGSLVDVLFRSNPGKNKSLPEITMTLLERIEVLAIGSDYISGKKVAADSGNATLAVTPFQAKALKVVEGRGEMTLLLRGQTDTVSTTGLPNMDRMTLSQLLGVPTQIQPKAIEVYRGGKKNLLVFPEPQNLETKDILSMPVSDGPTPQKIGKR